MTQSNLTEELRATLLDHFTEGAPSYAVANKPQKALAELKTERILPIIAQEVNATLDRAKDIVANNKPAQIKATSWQKGLEKKAADDAIRSYEHLINQALDQERRK